MSFWANLGCRTAEGFQNNQYVLTVTPFQQAAKETVNEDRQRIHVERQDNELRLEFDHSLISFSYAQPSFERFCSHYQSDGWVGRKIAALPDALLGIVRLVFHAVRLIFISTPNVCKAIFLEVDPSLLGKQTDVEVMPCVIDAFNLVRDMEEITGSLLRLINDRYGSYLVEDGLYHKERYACRLLDQKNKALFLN